VFAEYRQRINECEQRVARFYEQVRDSALTSPWQATIKALQCLRGFSLITAATVCAEVGSSGRFMNPRQLMSYAGLVPGEASSGSTVRRLSITKAGNAHLRRLIVEAAWQYRHHPHVGQKMRRRQKGQPAEVIAVSWRAQTRLNKRYRHLMRRGKSKPQAVVAVARELLGFVWEIMQIIPGPVASQELAA
jgi:transposase